MEKEMLAKFGDQTWSRKGVGIFERSNSNSFDLKSNGLNRKWGLGRSKNDRIFGGAPENDEIIYGQSWRPRIKIIKALGYFASVLRWFQNNGIFYYSSLNIGRVCYKEKSPCEFPRFKWTKNPYNLFSWGFKN